MHLVIHYYITILYAYCLSWYYALEYIDLLYRFALHVFLSLLIILESDWIYSLILGCHINCQYNSVFFSSWGAGWPLCARDDVFGHHLPSPGYQPGDTPKATLVLVDSVGLISSGYGMSTYDIIYIYYCLIFNDVWHIHKIMFPFWTLPIRKWSCWKCFPAKKL